MIRAISILLLLLSALTCSAALIAGKIAFERGGDIWIAKPDSSGQKLILKDASRPSWSPDRKMLAFARAGNVWTANPDGSDQRQLTHRWKDGEIMAISWNRKYGQITFSHSESFKVTQVGAKEGLTLDGTSIFDIWLSPPRFDPKLGPAGFDALAQPNAEILRFSLLEGGTMFEFSDNDQPAWSPSGKQMLFSRNGDIWIASKNSEEKEPEAAMRGWDVSRLKAVAVFDDPDYRADCDNVGISRLSWSPDEKVIAYSISRRGGSGDDELHLLKAKQQGNSPWWSVKSDELLARDAGAPSFSPDGRYLAYSIQIGEPAIWIADLKTHKKRQVLKNAEYPTW